MAKRTAKQPEQQPKEQTKPAMRWQIECGTGGAYVGSRYAERSTNRPLFSWLPDPARIIRFVDPEAAEAEFTRLHSYAANARLPEVG
jgi:hypothetical protein